MVEYIKIAVFFSIGVYIYERIDIAFALIFLLSLIMVLTVVSVFKHKFNTKILVMMTALVMGTVLCNAQVSENAHDLYKYEGRYVTVVGRVCEIPQDSEEDENVRYVIDVRKVNNEKVRDKILLTSDNKLEYGDTVTFGGFINELPEKLNRNGFDYKKYYKKYYVPNNSLITMVSSLSHDEAIKEIEKHFDNWEAKKLINLNIKDEKNKCVKKITTKENIELSTIVYLFTFYDLNKEDELALRILNHRLGESANSLLFREVRENRGLAYDIYSHLDITKNVKTLYIYTAVDEEDIEAASNAIEEIFRDIKTKKILIGDNDLNIMKKVHKTAVISTLEDSTELCSYILSQSLEGEDIFEFLKDMENLNNITADEIYEVANKVLNNPTIHILKSS